MKTTTQLINEAVERFKKEYVENGRLEHDKYLQKKPTDIINFLKSELQSLEKVVREETVRKFREVVDIESYEWDGGREDWEKYLEAISQQSNKEQE